MTFTHAGGVCTALAVLLLAPPAARQAAPQQLGGPRLETVGFHEREVARRSAGDVVGEMSTVTRSPRIASLIAEGSVRTVRIGRREFESILRERPNVALGVVRVLAERLAEGTGRA